MTKGLEQILQYVPSLGQEKSMYKTINKYATETYALYSGKPFGLMNSQPFLYGYDLPATGVQIHFHGSDPNHLTYGRIKDYSGNVLAEIKSSYDLAMIDLHAQNLGLKKFP